jgi:CRP-like cAMP-binding protein
MNYASASRPAPARLDAVRSATPSTSALEAPMQTLTFQRRQTLYHAGDAAQSVFRVRDGLVRITRMTPEGRVLTVRHLVPGDFFGEEAFMDGKRDEIAEALTTAQIEAIDPALINQQDLMAITRSLSVQMQRSMDYQYHLQTGDLRQRVARYLLKLSTRPWHGATAWAGPSSPRPTNSSPRARPAPARASRRSSPNFAARA